MLPHMYAQKPCLASGNGEKHGFAVLRAAATLQQTALAIMPETEQIHAEKDQNPLYARSSICYIMEIKE